MRVPEDTHAGQAGLGVAMCLQHSGAQQRGRGKEGRQEEEEAGDTFSFSLKSLEVDMRGFFELQETRCSIF